MPSVGTLWTGSHDYVEVSSILAKVGEHEAAAAGSVSDTKCRQALLHFRCSVLTFAEINASAVCPGGSHQSKRRSALCGVHAFQAHSRRRGEGCPHLRQKIPGAHWRTRGPLSETSERLQEAEVRQRARPCAGRRWHRLGSTLRQSF